MRGMETLTAENRGYKEYILIRSLGLKAWFTMATSRAGVMDPLARGGGQPLFMNHTQALPSPGVLCTSRTSCIAYIYIYNFSVYVNPPARITNLSHTTKKKRIKIKRM